MMKQYKILNGAEIKVEEISLLKQCLSSRDFNPDFIDYIDENSTIILMYDNTSLVGFSWLTICKELNLAELSWLVTNKDKIQNFDGKLLLDYSIKYCKNNNCDNRSWGRIKDKEKLFKKFGYNVNNDKEFDMSLEL